MRTAASSAACVSALTSVRSSLSLVWLCSKCVAADGDEQQAPFDSRGAQGIAYSDLLTLCMLLYVAAMPEDRLIRECAYAI